MALAGDSNSICSIKNIRFPAPIVSKQLEVALFRTLRGHEPRESALRKQDQKLKHAFLIDLIHIELAEPCRRMQMCTDNCIEFQDI